MGKTLALFCLFAAWITCGALLHGQDVYFTNRAETLYRSGGAYYGIVAETLWMPGYYLDVLRAGYRERLFEHEPFWRDGFPGYEWMDDGEAMPWYKATSEGGMWATNIFIQFVETGGNSYHLINGRIEDEGGAYSFDARLIGRGGFFEENGLLLNYFSEEGKARFTLQPDGDYLDVFINGERLFAFVMHSEAIIAQFRHLMYFGEVETLSRITSWPRRADGSTDFPPPDGSPVAQELGGTTAAEPSEPEPEPVHDEPEIITAEQPLPIVEAQDAGNDLPVLWFLAGGVVLVTGIVIVVARRKRS